MYYFLHIVHIQDENLSHFVKILLIAIAFRTPLCFENIFEDILQKSGTLDSTTNEKYVMFFMY